MRLNCDAHLGVNTAQERDVPTFPPGGGHAPSRRSTQNAPAEWTPPRRVARPRAPRLLEYVRATFRRGLRFACNSQPNTTANRGTVAGHEVITRSLSPPFLRQLQFEVSRSPGSVFRRRWRLPQSEEVQIRRHLQTQTPDDERAHEAGPCCGAPAQWPPHSPHPRHVHQDSARIPYRSSLRVPY